MIEKLFENLDEKVFTPELKDSLSTMFNEAVEAEKEVLSEAAEAHIDMLSEKAEEFKTILAEEAAEKEDALLEQVDAYLEKVVEEFSVEAQAQLDESLVTEKADLMVEAFDAMLLTGAVDVAKIVEAKDETEAETKLAESIEKYDALVEANIAVEKENAELIKMGVIAEMTADLSIVEAEKFEKLANIVEFTKSEAFSDKLDLIKESVKGAKVVDTKVEDEVLDEAVKRTYSHLI